MKSRALLLLIGLSAICSHAQTTAQTVTPAQLQKVLDLPLDQAVQLRETVKVPLRAAYTRQIGLSGKDCQAEIERGQQFYNSCMGDADAQADQDFAVFYNQLQKLCRDQNELAALHALEVTWKTYQASAMKAAHASWPDGTGAPGFAGQVYLSLLRDHMRQLNEIYGLNIAQ